MDYLGNINFILTLPRYVDKSVSIRNLVTKMTEEIPLAAEVLAGHKTFEAAVEPIVKENLAVKFPHYSICGSERFQNKAREITVKVKDIFDLCHLTEPLSISWFKDVYLLLIPFTLELVVGIIVWWLSGWTSPGELYSRIFNPKFTPWHFMKWSGIFCGSWALFFFFTGVLPAERYKFSDRRDCAERLRSEAVFLDKIFTKVRNGEPFN